MSTPPQREDKVIRSWMLGVTTNSNSSRASGGNTSVS